MKKKLLIISIALVLLLLIGALVFYFVTKDKNSEPISDEGYESAIENTVNQLEFLKLDSFDEVKEKAYENQIYIQNSDDPTFFAIGELDIQDNPVSLYYKLNEDGSINRFDGSFSLKLDNATADGVEYEIWDFNQILVGLFDFYDFKHCIYSSDSSLLSNDEEAYNKLLNGEAEYRVTIIDKSNTYWCFSAKVTEKKQLDFEFFRCFDLSVYNDESPDIDLRVAQEIGE